LIGLWEAIDAFSAPWRIIDRATDFCHFWNHLLCLAISYGGVAGQCIDNVKQENDAIKTNPGIDPFVQ
jgi:hypothetical protein